MSRTGGLSVPAAIAILADARQAARRGEDTEKIQEEMIAMIERGEARQGDDAARSAAIISRDDCK